MKVYQVEDAQPLHILEQAYGAEIMLEGHQNEAEAYRVMAEFALGDRQYAVLQSERQKAEDEVDIYRIVAEGAGQFSLEAIVDDDEWDDVFDIYDEMTYSFDDEEK